MNRINLITLGVKDISKAKTFYQAIGFKTFETAESPNIVFFNNNGTKLELYPLQALASDINEMEPPALSSQGFCGITFAMNAKTKIEVDQLLALAEAHGAKIVKPAQEVFWGGYSGYFTDLDGYYWEVAYAESWQFDEQEMLVIEP